MLFVDYPGLGTAPEWHEFIQRDREVRSQGCPDQRSLDLLLAAIEQLESLLP